MAVGTITASVETLADIVGSKTSGTFVALELVTQATTGATGLYLSSTTGHLLLYELHGAPDNSHNWVGAGGAIWAPTALPLALAVYARLAIESFQTGATYAFGLTGGNNVSASTPYIDGVSKGFDGTGASTTTAYRAYLTRLLRVPGTAATLDEVGSSPLVVRMALNDLVYQKDNTGGGNSGTAPTFTAPAGFIVNTAGAGQSSLASTAAACTNYSTLPYMAPRGHWDMTPPLLRMNADVDIGFDPQYVHGGCDGIACVKLDADGQTSIVNVPATKTARSAVKRTGTNLYSDSFRTVVTNASFTQGEQVKIRARVYPKRGDVIFDTNNQGSDYAVQHDSTLTWYCDKTLALQVYGVVDTGGGAGTASSNLATARAAPFATIHAALIAGATLIYFKNQTHLLATPGSTPSALGYWREIMPDPTDPGGTITIDTGFVTTKTDLRFTGCKIKLTGVTSILTSPTKMVWFDGCTGDNNGLTLAGPFCDDILGAFFTNCTGFDPSAWKLILSGADVVRHSFDGVDFGNGTLGAGAAKVNGWWKMTACKGSTVWADGAHSSSTAAANRYNRLFKNNLFLKVSNSFAFDLETADMQDNFFIGSILEGINLAGSAVLGIGQANAPEYNNNHGAVAHFNPLGGKTNYLYNDGPDSGGGSNDPKQRLFWGVVGVLFGNQEIKSESFLGTLGRVASRVGNWMHFLGSCAAGNFARLSDFPPDFRGIRSVQSVSDPLFTDDRSGDTGATVYHYNANSGLGGGDYSLQNGSPCFNQLPPNARHAAFTMLGTAIPNDGTGASGAWQKVSSGASGTGRNLGVGVGMGI